MNNTLYIILIPVSLLLVYSCSLSRKLLYYPAGISRERLEYIKNNHENALEIRIPANDKNILHGWLIEKDIKKLPTIIYFGGNAEEVSYNIEEFNIRLNCNFLLINYRGYGLSTGKPIEKKLKQDSELIYNYLVTNFQPDIGKIYVIGRSLGTGIAVDLAVKKNLKKTILITPYDSIENVAGNIFPKFIVKLILQDKYLTTNICGQLKNSVLLLAAEKDKVIPVKHAFNLYNRIACTKKIVIVEDADHNDISSFPEYWISIKDFIESG